VSGPFFSPPPTRIKIRKRQLLLPLIRQTQPFVVFWEVWRYFLPVWKTCSTHSHHFKRLLMPYDAGIALRLR
jgi:hypothetical protein